MVRFIRPNESNQNVGFSCEYLYDKYGDMLFRLCLSILLNQADAEDAVQDVFVKYVTQKTEYRNEEHAKAWLIHVARNRCRDMLRRRKIRTIVPLGDIAASEEPFVFENYELDNEDEGVLRRLFELSEKYKTVLVLHYLENQSIKTISESLGLSESAVKMRLSRGREMLGEKMTGI